MIDCRCGARVPVAAWHQTDFRCPECRRWLERCPGCLDWHHAMATNARFQCPACGLDRDAIVGLRTGELTMAQAREQYHIVRADGDADITVKHTQAGEVTL